MTGVAIRLDGVSKKYRIFDSPRQRLKEALDPFGRTYHRDFWALKDIDLVVPKGQTVGIIGRNGSGKSTLLQIITSVLQPTSGTVEVSGRVAALLELGAGFDPDFTGRQNVRQFGRLQGLKSVEIDARLPQVEAFADIGEFFDRPVKMYSSGMFARIAFAAAIHVDPDILVVDEILGVGDARFQERCARRIREMRERGTTILFVSHNTDQVVKLCDSAVLLDKGSVVVSGASKTVANGYHQLLYGGPGDYLPGNDAVATAPGDVSVETEFPARFLRAEGTSLASKPYYNQHEARLGNRDASIVDIAVLVNGSAEFGRLTGAERLTILVKVLFAKHIGAPQIGWAIVSPEGIMVSGSNTVSRRGKLPRAADGETALYRIEIQLDRLCPGEYFLNVGVGVFEPPHWYFLDNRRAVVHFSVDGPESASGFVDFDSTCCYCGSLDRMPCGTPNESSG